MGQVSIQSWMASGLDKYQSMMEGSPVRNDKEQSVSLKSFGGRQVRVETQDRVSIGKRSSDYKSANNSVRLDFLTSVCRAYGFLSTAPEGSDRFKADVLAFAEGKGNLPKKVVDELKLRDYKSFFGGKFDTGRPLTQSRIQKVLNAVKDNSDGLDAGQVSSSCELRMKGIGDEIQKFDKLLTLIEYNVVEELKGDIVDAGVFTRFLDGGETEDVDLKTAAIARLLNATCLHLVNDRKTAGQLRNLLNDFAQYKADVMQRLAKAKADWENPIVQLPAKNRRALESKMRKVEAELKKLEQDIEGVTDTFDDVVAYIKALANDRLWGENGAPRVSN